MWAGVRECHPRGPTLILMLPFVRRLLRRERTEPHAGPQGEDYDALQMERRWQEQRGRFTQNIIKKFAHKNFPFLDDPYN
jgi:hypothetical protein